jgi:hypothetical protein
MEIIMASCIDDEMDLLLQLEVEKIRQEDISWSEMMETDKAAWVEDRQEFLYSFSIDCDEEE